MADVANNPGGGGGDDRDPRRGDPSRGGCGGDAAPIKIPFYSSSESESDDESVRPEKLREQVKKNRETAEKFRDETKTWKNQVDSTLDGLASAVNEHTGEIFDQDARITSLENHRHNEENRSWFHSVIVWGIVAVLILCRFFGGSA